jgi:hypothetical protein
LPAIVVAIARASSTTSSSGTTLATRPHRSASAAVIGSPVSTIAIALDLPMARARRCVPPAPGITPRFTSGWPSLALSPATMRSSVIASSQPPPRAQPFTAAMTGFVTRRMRSSCATRLPSSISIAPDAAISLMSTPAAKARSLPVTTIARTPSS